MHDEVPENGSSHGVRRGLHVPNVVPKERLQEIGERAKDLDVRARAFIREHPVETVLAAVVVGFTVGRLLRRS